MEMTMPELVVSLHQQISKDGKRIAELEARNRTLDDFCKEFIWGEDNPHEYTTEYADAAIAEMEAENERWSEKYAALHARFAQEQMALDSERQKWEFQFERAEAPDAKLAERDRMLRLAWQTAAYVRGLDFPEWLVDLRSRAEDGSEDE